jgi:predicted amidohydrolase YtcJ
VAEGLRLEGLKTAEDIAGMNLKDSFYRDNWLVGFGWNHHNWPAQKLPDRSLLDRVFPDRPVFFSRVDGHASWINSAAISELQKRGYEFSQDPAGGVIARDSAGVPTGILFDQAHINALALLPDFTKEQHLSFFRSSQKIFNRAGFTHVRDLSMNLYFWSLLAEMEKERELSVYVESFVTAETPADLTRVLSEIAEIRKIPAKQLRVQGVKIFIDGSLGSRTAYLSQNYQGSETRGLLIWSQEEIQNLLRRVWSAGLQVAIHCIGDAAVQTAVLAAREVSASGVLGRLHLEHVQVLRPETVQLMKPLHITCYMQPCHWLSDRAWLRSVLPAELQSSLFQWRLLQKNKIPFFWGSDSPIEAPSLAATKQALELSPEWGIAAFEGDWKSLHSHPDKGWGNCWTELEQDRPVRLCFEGRVLEL